MQRTTVTLGSLLLVTLVSRSAWAETYAVGPSRALKTLQALPVTLQPGDVVELDGNATYPGGVIFRGDGTAGSKVTIRGIKVDGKRPIISGSAAGIELRGKHYVLESIEVTGSTAACIRHKSDDITIRDFVVHDCAHDGLIGNDDESGSLLLEHSEFFGSGQDQTWHQIYMTTAQDAYPGSVFRMQHCYVHDGRGGNNVKTRSERNEIYYNWIEGSHYHNLELIGADKDPPTPTREDSDVVGNVIVGNGSEKWHLVRVGGDKAPAETSGRYRFVNNTFVAVNGTASILRLSFRVDTVELHNNAFIRAGAGPLFYTNEVEWVSGPSIFGSNNWVQDGFTGTPGTWANTLTGTDPGFVNLAAFDLRLNEGSPLVDKGQANPASVSGRAFPKPLGAPAFVPPSRGVAAAAIARAAAGTLDIGAYEFGSGTEPGADGGSSSGGPGRPGNGSVDGGGAGAGATSSGGAAAGAGDDGDDGGGCGVVRVAKVGAFAGLAGLLGLVAVLLRRRRSADR